MSDGRRLEIPRVSVLEDNTTWREQITTLRTQLKKHGGHTAECVNHKNTWTGSADAGGHHPDKRKCDCGWDEIAKGLE